MDHHHHHHHHHQHQQQHRGGGGGGGGDSSSSSTIPPLHYTNLRSRQNTGKCSLCCSRIASALCSNIGVCMLVLSYTVGGAFIFSSIEGGDGPLEIEAPRESAVMDSLRQHAQGLRHETVEHLWTITESLNILYRDNWTRVAEQELLKFSEKLLTRLHEESPPPHPAPATATTHHTQPYQWTFAGSFLYSLTVITTIGYGSVAPQTALGRIVTIIYALLGIPLMLLYLSSVGDLLSRVLKWIWWRLCRCRRRRKPPSRNAPHPPTPYTSVDPSTKKKWGGGAGGCGDSEMDDDGDEAASVPVTLCLVLMIAYICGGAAVFSHVHRWPYLHAVYFCFSSLTTIGFGDLAPAVTPAGDAKVQIALIGAAFYLLVGMALIATCFNLMQEQMTNKGYGLGRKMSPILSPGGGSSHKFHLDDT